jgi:hypothetical protein
MPTVSEVVIGGKKMLSSARTARMKLVKNDTGTIANGVWTLNYLWSGMQSNSSRPTLYSLSTIAA